MAAPKKLPAQNATFARMKRPNRAVEPPAEEQAPAAPGTGGQTPVQPVVSAPVMVPVPQLAAVPDQPEAVAEQPAPAAEPGSAKTPTLTMFFTPPVKAAFKAKARRLNLTQPVALMIAIEDAYEDFGTLFGGATKDRKVRLFDLPSSALRDEDEGARDAAISMKVAKANIDVIDRLVDEVNAKSRNEFLFIVAKHWTRDEPGQ